MEVQQNLNSIQKILELSSFSPYLSRWEGMKTGLTNALANTNKM